MTKLSDMAMANLTERLYTQAGNLYDFFDEFDFNDSFSREKLMASGCIKGSLLGELESQYRRYCDGKNEYEYISDFQYFCYETTYSMVEDISEGANLNPYLFMVDDPELRKIVFLTYKIIADIKEGLSRKKYKPCHTWDIE